LSLGLALVLRFTRSAERDERLSAELDAARRVQAQLVPLRLPAVRNLRLQAAYLPAAEVGGDFYQVIPQPSGATLIVVGDVSGKGLKAAMTGTLAIGALRSLASEELSPAQILTRLNAQLAEASDGGFVTCLCARIGTDGSLILANAGHLAPYRNGEEMQVKSGLPLGIAPDATYCESAICLAPNDQLTFLSDGVIEARNPQGELFGFDRTAAISRQSADAIAHAALAFGQEDDITVLTLTFAAAEVLHG
jgi:serine phosphatase RsbU (regulator of sigma subunit)